MLFTKYSECFGNIIVMEYSDVYSEYSFQYTFEYIEVIIFKVFYSSLR